MADGSLRRAPASANYVEFGTQVAVQNSWATTDAELHPLREVPKWDWEEAPA
jgi:hemoglobin